MTEIYNVGTVTNSVTWHEVQWWDRETWETRKRWCYNSVKQLNTDWIDRLTDVAELRQTVLRSPSLLFQEKKSGCSASPTYLAEKDCCKTWPPVHPSLHAAILIYASSTFSFPVDGSWANSEYLSPNDGSYVSLDVLGRWLAHAPLTGECGAFKSPPVKGLLPVAADFSVTDWWIDLQSSMDHADIQTWYGLTAGLLKKDL